MENINNLSVYKISNNTFNEQSSVGLSCRNCYNRLNSNDPASQYQKQKIIQNTVRVQSSLYTMNLEGLAGYKRPLSIGQIVSQSGSEYYVPPNTYWNQQSDRPTPSEQKVVTGSGSVYHGSSTKHSIMRLRPGAMSPGGKGVDIKHNSYDRYLNKLKGKGPLKRGPIPPSYGLPIPFNRAFPIYGGKTIKTNIIDGCDCDINGITEDKIYGNPESAIQDSIFAVTYQFNIGDYVWANKSNDIYTYFKAQIIEILSNTYVVQFEDGTILATSVDNILIYTDCNCTSNPPLIDQILSGQYTADELESSKLCILTNAAVNAPYL
jgi:hypothetical protein